jgi:hypothetical protein
MWPHERPVFLEGAQGLLIKKLASSSCRRRICFQTLPEFLVPSTWPRDGSSNSERTENGPFSYTKGF